MAETKTSFPMLPKAHWWALREKFKQSIPGIVTDSYLAAALNMKVRSARTNVLPYLKDIGLIDEEGKTHDLAKAWRDDQQYAGVCKQIRQEIYPEDLLSAVPNPMEDREAAQRWFANHTGVGISAVRRMTQFYTILSEADASRRPQKTKTPMKSITPKRVTTGKTTPKKTAAVAASDQISPSGALAIAPISPPDVSINLEIHISADATPDQIDKIFESMAKHIYKK